MPIHYELRNDAIWLTSVGDVDYDAGMAVFEAAIVAAHEHDAGLRWHVVFDIHESSENRNADELRSIAEFVAQSLSVLSGRCVVLAGDLHHFGLGRMFEAYSAQRGVQVDVMRSAEALDDWLKSVATAGRE